MKTTIISVIGLIIALFTWASYTEIHSWKLKEGIIVSKKYRAAYTSTSMMSVPNGNGGTTLIPTTEFHPETWSITIKGRASDGEELTRRVSVDQTEFHAVEEGQLYKVH